MRRSVFGMLFMFGIVLLGSTGCNNNGGDGEKDKPQGQAAQDHSQDNSQDNGQDNGQQNGKQSAGGPEDVARKFLDASAKRDLAAIKRLVTKKSLPFIEKKGAPANSPKTYQVGKAKVTGETARVPVETDNGRAKATVDVLLKRDGGQWRVYGMSMPPLFTLNFEQPKKLKPSFPGKSKKPGGSGKVADDPFSRMEAEDDEPPPPPLKSVSAEQFNNSWQSDFQFEDRPARELLAELAKQAGMELHERTARLPQLDQSVSLDLKDAPLVKAIEEVCRQIGVRPRYRSSFRGTQQLMFVAGARPKPPVYAGPFAVSVDSLEVVPQYGTGKLKLAVVGFNLPEPVRRMRERQRGPLLQIDELTSSSGRDVLQASSQSWGSDGSQQVPLKNLLRDVETISVKGTVTVPIPVDVQQLRFTNLQEGETKSAGDVQVTLKQSDSRRRTEVRLQYQKPATGGDLSFTAFDADGNTLKRTGRARFTFGSRVHLELTFEGRPASLKVEHAGRSATFKKMEAGQKQQLNGTDITLRKVRIADKHRVSFEFTNLDRKRIFVTGLDADGKPLQSSGHSGFSGRKKGRVGTTIEGSPKEIVVSVVAGLKEQNYDVELTDIPVPDARRRPEKLQPLQFTGDAPVSLEFLRISGDGNFKKVELRVKNISNKDIRKIDMRLHYLDASGKELKDWPANATGSFDPQTGQRKPVVEKNGTADVKVTAFFMPDETRSVRLELEGITCADATTWKRKKD